MDLTALNHEDPILKVLGAAQGRIEKPENWCKGRLYYGHQVCANGAVMVALGMPTYESWHRLFSDDKKTLFKKVDNYLTAAAKEAGFSSAPQLNNATNHPTTYAMFDRAREIRMADIMEMAGAAP